MLVYEECQWVYLKSHSTYNDASPLLLLLVLSALLERVAGDKGDSGEEVDVVGFKLVCCPCLTTLGSWRVQTKAANTKNLTICRHFNANTTKRLMGVVEYHLGEAAALQLRKGRSLGAW